LHIPYNTLENKFVKKKNDMKTFLGWERNPLRSFDINKSNGGYPHA
jgi:hypothetical protein